MFGKSDPYFKIYREKSGGNVLLFESEVIKNTLDPTWKDVDIWLSELNGEDMNRNIVFDVYDWDKM
jgi:hypothetical protein